MQKITVDAVGDTCPIPVVKTKNAIKGLTGESEIQIYVDNEIAVQNLVKMAKLKQYPVSSEKLDEQKYCVTMTVSPQSGTVSAPDGQTENAAPQADRIAPQADCDTVCQSDARRRGLVAVISSSGMGQGDDELGKILMKAFLYALSQQEELPETILFYNSGVFLTCEDSPAIEDLKSMEAQGVAILSCGTCLNHYQLTECLKVGGVTNMYDIVEKMSSASNVIRP